jgi:hypothetical protein
MPFTSKTSARVTNRIPLVVTAFGTGSKRSAKTAASKIGKRVQEVIREPGRTGRMYGTHQASAPGEPPANWTGELAGSVTVEPGPGHSAYMIVGAEYAPGSNTGRTHGPAAVRGADRQRVLRRRPGRERDRPDIQGRNRQRHQERLGEIPVTEVYVAMRWIHSVLEADSTLCADRRRLAPIYDSIGPRADGSIITLPAVVYSLQTPMPDTRVVNSVRLYNGSIYLVRGIAEWPYTNLDAIAARIDALLHLAKGTISGGEVLSSERESPFEMFEPPSGGSQNKQSGGLFLIRARVVTS